MQIRELQKKYGARIDFFPANFFTLPKFQKKPHSSLGDFFGKGRKHNIFHEAAREIEKRENPGGEDEARRPFLKAEGD